MDPAIPVLIANPYAKVKINDTVHFDLVLTTITLTAPVFTGAETS